MSMRLKQYISFDKNFDRIQDAFDTVRNYLLSSLNKYSDCTLEIDETKSKCIPEAPPTEKLSLFISFDADDEDADYDALKSYFEKHLEYQDSITYKYMLEYEVHFNGSACIDLYSYKDNKTTYQDSQWDKKHEIPNMCWEIYTWFAHMALDLEEYEIPDDELNVVFSKLDAVFNNYFSKSEDYDIIDTSMELCIDGFGLLTRDIEKFSNGLRSFFKWLNKTYAPDDEYECDVGDFENLVFLPSDERIFGFLRFSSPDYKPEFIVI